MDRNKRSLGTNCSPVAFSVKEDRTNFQKVNIEMFQLMSSAPSVVVTGSNYVAKI